MPPTPAGRLRRLDEELAETGLQSQGTDEFHALLLEEIDHALRPVVHERRISSGGTIIEPASDPATWATGAQLGITRGQLDHQPLMAARRFADGLSCWLVRRVVGD